MPLWRLILMLATLTLLRLGRLAEAQEPGSRGWAANVIVPQARGDAMGRQPVARIELVRAGVVVRGQTATTLLEAQLRNPGAGRLGAELLLPVPSAPAPKPPAFAKAAAPRNTVRAARPRRAPKEMMLDLENAISQAELVLVVRLVEMTETKIVHGGKSESITQQFRFEPVRPLKGVFARDALLLTGQDLGIYQFTEGSDALERGQLLLLLLGRQGPGYFNCNQASTLEQSIPRLRNPADPLLAAVEALINVTHQPDRAAKVAILSGALQKASDRDAVPLLLSLRRRALLAAQTPEVAGVVMKFIGNSSPVVRDAAIRTLAAVLEADYLRQRGQIEQAVKVLVAALDSAGPDLSVRVAAFDALGATGEAARDSEPARAWLRADRPATTFAEHAARLRAIGAVGRKDQLEPVSALLERLPLDAPADVQIAAGRALGRLEAREAVPKIAARLASKSDAGLGITGELVLLGELPRESTAPALLDAFPRLRDQDERFAFAVACGRVADPSLVPSVGALLDPREPNVRWQAAEALREIDTDEAASVLWPHLSQEVDLLRKLQLAEFLGRHGFRGGYPYAIEHMSAPQLTDVAVEALAAIREPKAVQELNKIWESSNDVAWSAAAIRGLGRLGEAEIAPRLLELARDLKQPLAIPAVIALGDLGEPRAIPIVRDGLGSRSDQVVISACRAARKLLAAPNARADDILDRLAALLADAHASLPVREAAFESLVALEDTRLGPALGKAVRDGGLENSPLLERIERRLAERKQSLNLE
jgi:HEAT repeat protein